ncbi:metal-dependent hydrolase [Defluviimonas sp. WL0024]|uniref:Metal-dependent hydrolase n=2 Tax=Albidovulum TaxID=205889 RepID=A0ABT3J5V5_9RHOB|nr:MULTISPECIES: metal-dependent hydrolase [Defluviimonas]MCU9849586.1 metal-dependent hydrolase [Defluviimonas sp. WL0024]MCW3783081.1 metal-dependent hydrolase [Defluviimonas salinarum]
MLTAHLPAGYVLARRWPRAAPGIVPAALVASVLPDTDLVFFYLVDDRAIHHHRYWVHVPAFWLAVAAIVLPLLRRSRYLPAALAFLAAIFLHLALDTIGGGILWLAPFSDRMVELVTVPATRSHWVASFVLHWTFLLELGIWGTAIALFLKGRRT